MNGCDPRAAMDGFWRGRRVLLLPGLNASIVPLTANAVPLFGNSATMRAADVAFSPHSEDAARSGRPKARPAVVCHWYSMDGAGGSLFNALGARCSCDS